MRSLIMPTAPKDAEKFYRRAQRLEELKDRVPEYLQGDFEIGLVEPEDLEKIVSKN